MSDAKNGSALIIPEPRNIRPGLVPTGFAESVLARIADEDDPAKLWDGATTLAALAQKWNGHGREKNEIKSAQMFVEVELGQRLGPNPVSPPGKRNPHADISIPAQRVNELRRFHGHRDLLVEEIRNGNRSRRGLLLAVDRAEALGRETPEAEDLDITTGDFREVLADLEDESVALVLTDPPYPEKYLPLWDDLGAFAARTLAAGGSLVAYCGQSILPEVLRRLSPRLRYWWTLALTHGHGSQMIPGKYVSCGWKPLVWFVRGRRGNAAMIPDRISGSAPRKTIPTGDDGEWAQGVDELESVISGLTNPGDLIVDPFAGSGTVGVAALKFGRRFRGATLGPSADKEGGVS